MSAVAGQNGAASDRVTVGIGLALLAYSLLAIQDATVKWLVVTVPVCQVLFVRSAMVLAGCVAVGGAPLLTRARQTPIMGLLIWRGAVTLAAWFCYFTAARSMPLAQLTTLWFTAPVIVTLLAAPLLHERVGPARWIAVGIGFAGTVAAANPAGLTLSPAAGLVLLAAGLWAIGVLLTRVIARHEPSLVQMLYNNAFFFIATGIASALAWHRPVGAELWLLGQVALLGGFGQFCLFEAARRAPASLTAPLEYTTLLWAFLLGFAVWGDVPGRWVLLGAAMILSAGLLLIVAERQGIAAKRSRVRLAR
ncbi:MAG TPA: DMT family transporter [Acetobacteraceae bacterium]|nr:DMT family transporter [Acetobacteraceae bacterium]